MNRNITRVALAVFFAVLCAIRAGAADLTPELYVQIELEVRTITNASLQHRLPLERGDEAARAESKRISAVSRGDIQVVYRNFGTSANKHVRYGNRNAKEIAQWLADHPEWQQMLDALDREFQLSLNSYSDNRNTSE